MLAQRLTDDRATSRDRWLLGPGSARRCAALGRDDNREIASQIDRDVL